LGGHEESDGVLGQGKGYKKEKEVAARWARLSKRVKEGCDVVGWAMAMPWTALIN